MLIEIHRRSSAHYRLTKRPFNRATKKLALMSMCYFPPQSGGDLFSFARKCGIFSTPVLRGNIPNPRQRGSLVQSVAGSERLPQAAGSLVYAELRNASLPIMSHSSFCAVLFRRWRATLLT